MSIYLSVSLSMICMSVSITTVTSVSNVYLSFLVFLSFCLNLSSYPSVYLSIYQSVNNNMYVCIYNICNIILILVSFCLFVYLSDHLSAMSICLSICQSVNNKIYKICNIIFCLFVYQQYVSFCLSFNMHIFVSISP